MKIRNQAATVCLIGIYVVLYLLPLGARPLIIPDESRYFAIPSEMIVSGDWIVPHLDGVRYFEKPVLGYWLNALSMKVFGQNAFAVRFPAAASVGLSALFLFFLVRKFSRDPLSALFTVTIFLTCLQVWAIGVFSVLDSQLSMMLTGAVIAYFFACQSVESKQKNVFLILCGLFCGLAFLTKGFLAFVVPLLAIVPFMAWERRLKDFFLTAWLPITSAILISLPWCIMVHLREGDFWHYFFWIEHIERFLSPNEGQHGEPFWFYVPGLIAGMLPWSALLPAMAQGIKNTDKSDALFRLAVCWFLGPFLFFSVSSGKLLPYILPCFPPLAILMGKGLRLYLQSKKTRAYNLGTGLLGGVILIGAVILAANQLTGFIGKKPYAADETWKWLIACLALAIWGIIAFVNQRKQSINLKLLTFGFAPVLFYFSAGFIIPDMVSERKAPSPLFNRNLVHIQPDTIIVSDTGMVRAACAYLKRTDIYLVGGPGELEYGLAYKDTKWKWLSDEQFKQLISQKAGKKSAGSDKPALVLTIKRRTYKKYAHLLPPPVYFDRYGEFVFMSF